LAWLASGLFILFIVVLIIRFGLGIIGSVVRFGIVATLVLLIAAATVTTYKYRHDYLTRRVVIIAEDAPVRTGPYEHTDTELEGAPGLVVEIVDETDDYYDILFENRRRGWIKKSFVAEI
jgi:SH3-like domain-containing protein